MGKSVGVWMVEGGVGERGLIKCYKWFWVGLVGKGVYDDRCLESGWDVLVEKDFVVDMVEFLGWVGGGGVE